MRLWSYLNSLSLQTVILFSLACRSWPTSGSCGPSSIFASESSPCWSSLLVCRSACPQTFWLFVLASFSCGLISSAQNIPYRSRVSPSPVFFCPQCSLVWRVRVTSCQHWGGKSLNFPLVLHGCYPPGRNALGLGCCRAGWKSGLPASLTQLAAGEEGAPRSSYSSKQLTAAIPGPRATCRTMPGGEENIPPWATCCSWGRGKSLLILHGLQVPADSGLPWAARCHCLANLPAIFHSACFRPNVYVLPNSYAEVPVPSGIVLEVGLLGGD